MNSTVSVIQQKHNDHQFGFTLIELLLVISILGVLVAVATPKFIDFKKSAVISGLQEGKAAFASANSQIYSKAIIQNQHAVNSSILNIDVDSDNQNDIIGYFGLIKFVVSARQYAGLSNKLTLSKYYGVISPTSPWFVIYFKDNPPAAGNECHVEVYYPTEAGGSVTYTLKEDDC